MRTQTYSNQVDGLQRFLQKPPAKERRPTLRRCLLGVEATMLRLYTFEQRGYSFVVRVIQRNGDTVASSLSDEIGSFAYCAA